MLRTAQPEDEAEFIRLWYLAFPQDPPDFAAYVFRRLAGPDRIWLMTAPDGTLQSGFCSLPCTLSGRPGRYLYGGFTNPDFLRRGIFTRLMCQVEEQAARNGSHFLVLVPANDWLKQVYLRPDGMGYQWAFDRCLSVQSTSGAVPPPLRSLPVEADTLTRLRDRYLPRERLALTPQVFAVLCEDLRASDARLLTTAEGYALTVPGEKGPVCLELATTGSAQALIDGLCAFYQTEHITMELPAPACPFPGKREHFAMLRPLVPDFTWYDPYIALDCGI